MFFSIGLLRGSVIRAALGSSTLISSSSSDWGCTYCRTSASDEPRHGNWTLARQRNGPYGPSLRSSRSRTSSTRMLLGKKASPAARFERQSARSCTRYESVPQLFGIRVRVYRLWLLLFPPNPGAHTPGLRYFLPLSTGHLWFAGRSHHVARTNATGSKVAPMLHPPGPSKLYPEANQALQDFLAEIELEQYQKLEEEMLSGSASGSPETTGVIETPPEWGRPDEGNPNQPRRPPEYNPPQVCNMYTALGSALLQ